MKDSKKYYILGVVLCVIAAVIAIIAMTLPMAIPEHGQLLGWIGLGIVIVAIILFFFGIYLVKKGNFIKLNKVNEEAKNLDKQFEDKLEEKYKD